MNFSESPRAMNFYLDSPVAPKLDLSGARSHFYRPPKTPSAASSLSRSVAHSPSWNQGSRKRARYNYDEYDSGYGDNVDYFDDCAGGLDDKQSICRSGFASPAPLVNTQYRLAGGIETPHATSGLATFSRYDDLNSIGNGPEVDYRPSRYNQSGHSDATGTREGNPKKRGRRPSTSESDIPFSEKQSSSTPSSKSWGQTVLNLVNKVWDFCWSGPFRGFYAGGGKGYDINPGTTTASQSAENSQCLDRNGGINEKDTLSVSTQPFVNPQEKDGLRSDWVLVKNDSPAVCNNTPSHFARRPPRRSSIVHVASRRTAARPIVSKRAGLVTAARQSSSYRHQYSSSLGSNKADSPIALEAQRFAAKLRKQEREEDASIRRLNQQLKAMIREGKEALGTRVEIDDLDLEDSD
ncbi:hypothetical protein VTO42DRAFT_7634 [Malbranchea cinnamomea]